MTLLLNSCSENYSNGERIGTLTKLSKAGLIFDTWEGSLNLTQTGMNTSGEPFDFSIDRDNYDESLKVKCDSAATNGWKVKVIYKQVKGWNWFSNRGNSNHFIKDLIILDKNFTSKLQFNNKWISFDWNNFCHLFISSIKI